MKGAILAVAPSASLVDLTHAVHAQDVFAGAFLLWTAVEAFPAGTVHVAVVDPGVGSLRRAVAVQVRRGDTLVGPDNGLLVAAAGGLGGIEQAVELTQTRYWRTQPSSTFHGRDIFAPVAAHLAAGAQLEQLGTPVELQKPFELAFTEGPRGEVIHVDAFGNLVTNFLASRLPARYEVLLGGRRARGVPYYAAAELGELVALVGSSGLLEISVRDGSAAAAT